MIEEDFYATIKLISGEEIFSKVSPVDENNEISLLVNNPVIITEIKDKDKTLGYKLEPWLKTTTEDMFIINMNNIITINESKDVEMISIYQSYIRKVNNIRNNKTTVSRKMGYITTVRDAKEILERLFNNS
jgi:hypothetical protein